MTASNQWNLRCQGCGQNEEFDLPATVWVRLCPDGTGVTRARNGDHEWDDRSTVYCNACDFRGKVRDLRGTVGSGQSPVSPLFSLRSGSDFGDNGEGWN